MPRRTDRLWISFGLQLRDARRARSWSVRELAHRAGLSPSMTYRVEAGEPSSTDAALKLAAALGQRAELSLIDPRRKVDSRRSLAADAVHSAMGELEASHLRDLGFGIGLDEPYQHYQFAGRADLVAWDLERRALLHIENRTRFPDLQAMAGSYNAKRAYLAAALAERAGVRRWSSETHVIAALWTAEVLHVLRLRRASFEALCPSGPESFDAWWSGQPPLAGTSSALVVLDPAARGRQRRYIGLAEAQRARPRHRGYADAALALASPAAL
ncbi:MAG TPA: helix-turn-helix domain-containing protein [Candidatus Limnocylindrales bacterium]